MSTKYETNSSATSIDPDVAAVTIASLKSLSCLDRVIDSSHLAFFCSDKLHVKFVTGRRKSQVYLVQMRSQATELQELVLF